MGHSSNSAAATAAVAVLILTLSASTCKAASPLPPNFVNVTVTPVASMWCNGVPEKCLAVEENINFNNIVMKTGNQGSSICGRYYMGRYISCIDKDQASSKPPICRNDYDRTCSK